jgi:hypothetical protein
MKRSPREYFVFEEVKTLSDDKELMYMPEAGLEPARSFRSEGF